MRSCRSIIDLGHNLGLDVVAEGVEDTATLGALIDMGCDRAQGFLLSAALAADDVPHVGQPAPAWSSI